MIYLLFRQVGAIKCVSDTMMFLRYLYSNRRQRGRRIVNRSIDYVRHISIWIQRYSVRSQGYILGTIVNMESCRKVLRFTIVNGCRGARLSPISDISLLFHHFYYVINIGFPT